MTYRGMDKGRLQFLLRLGTDGDMLRRFFRESRVALILAGAKVQNLPQAFDDCIHVLATRVPGSTDPIVSSWFRKNYSVLDPEDPQIVIAAFERAERMGLTLPEESLRELARSCLFHVVQEPPQQDLLEFLRTPIGPESKDKDDDEERLEDERSEPGELGSPSQTTVFAVLADLMTGKDPDEHLSTLPQELAACVSGLRLAVAGKLDEAAQATALIPPDHELRGVFDTFLNEQRLARERHAARQVGLVVIEPEAFEGGFDVDEDEVVCYCTNANSPAAVFLKPLAVRKRGQILFVSEEARKQIFPETGDIMAFEGRGHPRQPKRGEIGIWRVAEHTPTRPGQRTRFHIVGEKLTVYETRLIGFASDEPDSVRSFVQENVKQEREAQSKRRLQAPVIFELQDGLLIKPDGDFADLTRDEAFEEPFLAWRSLPGFRFEGVKFVAGPLPGEQLLYDCSPLAVTARKLFGPLRNAGHGPVQLTRTQLASLAKMLDEKDIGIEVDRVARIRSGLDRLSQHQEALSTIVDELFEQPSIRDLLNRRIEESVTARLEEKKQLRADIDLLVKQRDEWHERIKREREQLGKLPEKVSEAVAAAFGRAQKEGLATLGEMALFKGLVGQIGESSEHHASRSVPFGPLIDAVPLSPAAGTPEEVLTSLGSTQWRAKALVAGGTAVLRAGLILCLRGVAARAAAQRWGQRVLSETGTLIDVPVGIVDDGAIKALLRSRPSVVVIRDANLSAMEAYLRPLVDLVVERLGQGGTLPQPVIIMTVSEGISSLPIPRQLKALAVTIELDEGFSDSDLKDESALLDPESGVLSGQLWRAAVPHLREALKDIPEELRGGAIAALMAGSLKVNG